jgi:hypothetical protein
LGRRPGTERPGNPAPAFPLFISKYSVARASCPGLHRLEASTTSLKEFGKRVWERARENGTGFPACVNLRSVSQITSGYNHMDLNRAIAWRRLVGRATALFCLLACLAILDGLFAKFQEPLNVLHVLPGDQMAIDGPIPENIKDTGALTYTSDSKDLAVDFVATHPGYFLGGNMWRGHLTVGRNQPPGKYIVTVRPRNDPASKPGYQFRVLAYRDAPSQRSASKSLSKRHTGISPYLWAAALLPLILISLGVVYLLSQRIEALQAKDGLAEIYRVTREEGRILVTFGLGTAHGVGPGDQVTILDPEGNYAGSAQVQESTDQDSVGLAAIDRDIRPGYLVSRT